jgi:S1-C subfamily serine protease
VENLRRRASDPKVRTALEKIAAEDADSRLRELASKPLAADEKAFSATGGQQRLGVMTRNLQPAPDVPGDLVGKLAVVRIGSGSVADRAGMQEADVLLQIDGKAISSGPQLIEVLDALPRGVNVEVVVSRSGQTVRLAARF